MRRATPGAFPEGAFAAIRTCKDLARPSPGKRAQVINILAAAVPAAQRQILLKVTRGGVSSKMVRAAAQLLVASGGRKTARIAAWMGVTCASGQQRRRSREAKSMQAKQVRR